MVGTTCTLVPKKAVFMALANYLFKKIINSLKKNRNNCPKKSLLFQEKNKELTRFQKNFSVISKTQKQLMLFPFTRINVYN